MKNTESVIFSFRASHGAHESHIITRIKYPKIQGIYDIAEFQVGGVNNAGDVLARCRQCT